MEEKILLFSLIVPLYNVEKYLKRCIESLINQTYDNIEILLIDDGSTDNSLNICSNYSKVDNRIKVFHKENGGLSDARNYGIDRAKGDYVIFIDSDDYIDTDTCEKFLPYCKENCDIIIGNAYVQNKTEEKIKNYYINKVITGKEFLLEGYKNSAISMAAWLYIYKRTFLIENHFKFKYGIYHEDEEFTPRTLMFAEKVRTTGEFFYHYDVRDDSITTKKNKRKNAEDLYNTLCELEKIYNNINDNLLRKYLLNSISEKYLSLYYAGRLYQYGERYIHRLFVLKNAKLTRTRLKAIIYIIFPRFYYFINCIYKRRNKS